MRLLAAGLQTQVGQMLLPHLNARSERESFEAARPCGRTHCHTQIGIARQAFGAVDETSSVVDRNYETCCPIIDNGASPGYVGRDGGKPSQPRLDKYARHAFTFGQRCKEEHVE